MTIIEKIVAKNTVSGVCYPDDEVLLNIDCQAASDYNGIECFSFFENNNLKFKDTKKSIFLIETGVSGGNSIQYEIQSQFRQTARKYNVKLFDIEDGIGCQNLIENGLIYTASTLAVNSPRACIASAVSALGIDVSYSQLAQIWDSGQIKFTVPSTFKIILKGKRPKGISGRDIAWSLLECFGTDKFAGKAIEITGDEAKRFTLDERISIASLAPELGAISIFFEPSEDILDYCSFRSKKKIKAIKADDDAVYSETQEIDITKFSARLCLPEKPLESVDVLAACDIKIDKAFVGGLLNGRLQDMREIASILRTRKVASGVKFFISPATSEIWKDCLNEGLFQIFINAGAIVMQTGETGFFPHHAGVTVKGEVCISTAHSNFKSQTGDGETFLASTLTVTASATVGCICSAESIPEIPSIHHFPEKGIVFPKLIEVPKVEEIIEGRVVILQKDNFAVEKIIPQKILRYGTQEEILTSIFSEYNAEIEDENLKIQSGDILIAPSCFGIPDSSRQLLEYMLIFGIKAVLAESFHYIFQQNAQDLEFVAMAISNLHNLRLETGDKVRIDLINKTISKV